MPAPVLLVRPNSAPRRPASSRRASCAAALLRALVLIAALPLAVAGAQSDVPPDSLALRLRRAEESIALLQQQLAEQATASVTTRGRLRLELTGRVLVQAFRNERRVNNADAPQFVRPDTGLLAGAALGMSARQTTLGMVLTADGPLGGRFTGDVDVDFHGGQQPSSGGRTFPLLRLRTARAAVRWARGELLVGQESPLVAALSPLSPASVGTPAFAAAGNLWLWLPQVRGTVELGGPLRAAAQLALLAPTTGDAQPAFDTDADAAERSRRPVVQARARVRWGEDEGSEAGCGAHLGWVAATLEQRHRTTAVACDARVVAGRVELRAEGYSGRGLRGLGGGGIGQNLGRDGTPLADRGGWAQGNVDAHALVRAGIGCGADRPRADDVPVGGRLANRACAVHATLRPGGPLFVGAEVRRLATGYTAGTVVNHHLSVVSGFEF